MKILVLLLFISLEPVSGDNESTSTTNLLVHVRVPVANTTLTAVKNLMDRQVETSTLLELDDGEPYWLTLYAKVKRAHQVVTAFLALLEAGEQLIEKDTLNDTVPLINSKVNETFFPLSRKVRELNVNITALEKGFNETHLRLDEMNKRIDGLNDTVHVRFDEMNKRIDGLNVNIDCDT